MAKKYNIGDFLKDINYEKKNLLRNDSEAMKEFTPFLINRNLSNFIDTILHVQELNQRANMDKSLQYDYLIYAINKRKRFAKTPKAEKINDIEKIKEFYNVNDEKANTYYSLISEKHMENIRNQFVIGGK